MSQEEKSQEELGSEEIRRFTSWLGQQSYKARLERFGKERLQKIARENGKKGGRPRRGATKAKKEGE